MNLKNPRLLNIIKQQLNKRNSISIILILVIPDIAVIIVLPASVGAMAVALGLDIGPLKDTPELNISLATTAGIGLAVLAAALSAIVSWIVRIPLNSHSPDARDNDEKRVVNSLGRFFLLAALCFTMFAIFVPLLPEVKDKSDWWSDTIKYSTVIFLIAGGVILAMTTLWGIFQILNSMYREMIVTLQKSSKQRNKQS